MELLERLRQNRNATIMALVLLAVVAIGYSSTLGNGFVWEDYEFIENNAFLHNPENMLKIFTVDDAMGTGKQNPYFRPITTLSFAIDHQIWGNSAFGFHLTNLLAHLGVCLLLFKFASRYFPLFAAFGAALFFGLHPANTEPVGYVSARADLLCSIFLLSTLFSFLRFKETGNERHYALSLALFALALLSKILAVIVPFLLLGILLIEGDFKKHAKRVAPYFLLIGAYFVYRDAVLVKTTWFNDPLLTRISTAGLLLVNYLRYTVLPFGHKVWYTLSPAFSIDLSVAGAYLLFGSFTLFFACKAKQWPIAALGAFWYVLGLAPVSGIVMLLVPTLIADRYLYIPLLGFSLMVAQGLQWLWAKATTQNRKKVIVACVCMAALVLGVQIDQRIGAWQSNLTFWRQAIKDAPGINPLKFNYAMALSHEGRLDEAKSLFLEVKASGDNDPSLGYQLAKISFLKGEMDKSEELIVEALKNHPDHIWSYLLFAHICIEKGNLWLAERAVSKALELNPWNIWALETFQELKEKSLAGAK